MSDFDIFKNRWFISTMLELDTPLRIGGGQNAAAYSISAAPVLLTFDAEKQLYEPYIPGSSLKGVLRSTVERLIRTFDVQKSCVSVKNSYDKDEGRCKGCTTCDVFGSMEAGAKIRVRDAHLSDLSRGGISVKDQPHCATKYVIQNGSFIPKTKPSRDRNKKIGPVDTFLRVEETVMSGVCFDVQIDTDNADEKEIGLILLALDEFNKKRIQLGGGTSRGNGFANIQNITVTKKTINEDFIISESIQDVYSLMKAGKQYLSEIDSGKDPERRDFDIYHKAHSPKNIEGHIVAKMKVTTLTDFIMPGVEEVTVTNGGLPIIPGSTIKGFFRHSLVDKCDAQTIKEIFGFTDNHRGRFVVSDAYSDDLIDSDVIPADSILNMWMVFDNMTENEVELIDGIIKQSRNVVTGRTTSKFDPKTKSAPNNVVNMEYENIDIFRTSDYLKEV